MSNQKHLQPRHSPGGVVIDLTYRQGAAILAGFVLGAVYDAALVLTWLGVL